MSPKTGLPIGKYFRLHTTTLALDSSTTGRMAFTHIPEDGIIQVIDHPASSAMMAVVLFEGRELQIFIRDITDRGEELSDDIGIGAAGR